MTHGKWRRRKCALHGSELVQEHAASASPRRVQSPKSPRALIDWEFVRRFRVPQKKLFEPTKTMSERKGKGTFLVSVGLLPPPTHPPHLHQPTVPTLQNDSAGHLQVEAFPAVSNTTACETAKPDQPEMAGWLVTFSGWTWVVLGVYREKNTQKSIFNKHHTQLGMYRNREGVSFLELVTLVWRPEASLGVSEKTDLFGSSQNGLRLPFGFP